MMRRISNRSEPLSLPRGELAKDILKGIVIAGAMLTVIVVAPGAAGVSIKFIKKLEEAISEGKGYLYRYRIKRAIAQLQEKRLVEVKEIQNGYELRITASGKQIIKRLHLDQLTIQPTHHWDGTWRIVGFDIPERDKPAREALRRLLKRLGFYPLQKSVWILPWPCRDELEVIRAAYDLSDTLWYCEAAILDREIELQTFFNLLTYPITKGKH